MTGAKRRYTGEVPGQIEDRVRSMCLNLPEVHEERAWVGTRWMVRKRTFAHVLGVEDASKGSMLALAFRSEGEELEALRNAGHPFLVPGWGRNALGMVLDDTTEWDEVRDMLTDSYCAMAPHKLVALIERPDEDDGVSPHLRRP
jgi:predicted DNA-binding protein (MmcQ/YjbR family)